jgi:hypothetical protein
VPRDNSDTAGENELLRRFEGAAELLQPGSPIPTLNDLLRGRTDLADRFAPRSGIAVSWPDLHEIDLLSRELQKATAALLRTEILGAAPDKSTPAKSKRPPAQLVVLVLIWLILIAGPLADGKLPNEVQAMLSTEVGTVALGIAITQWINQKRK